MKKIYIIIFFCTTGMLTAQVTFKLGVIKSTIHSSNYKDIVKYKSGITPLFGGIYYGIKASDFFRLETGLQYQGYIGEQDTDISTKRHYLSLPLSVNVKPSSIVSPGFGIHTAVLISDNYKVEFIENKIDFSCFAKLNINVTSSIGAEIGYNLGLIPFSKLEVTDSSGNPIGTSKLTNRYFYFAAKYSL